MIRKDKIKRVITIIIKKKITKESGSLEEYLNKLEKVLLVRFYLGNILFNKYDSFFIKKFLKNIYEINNKQNRHLRQRVSIYSQVNKFGKNTKQIRT